jgi:hypothetical protein
MGVPMKYNVITINARNNKWFASFNKVAFNRVKRKTKPNPFGFYYFPDEIPVEQAFVSIPSRRGNGSNLYTGLL